MESLFKNENKRKVNEMNEQKRHVRKNEGIQREKFEGICR
jgi:hypothetical protein